MNYFQHICRRIDEIGNKFRQKVLLVLVDDENNLDSIKELNKISFSNNYTLILGWSNLECARYIETFKFYDGKTDTSSIHIQERIETEFLPKLTQILTNIRSINRTDVSTLVDVFGNLRGICAASESQLVQCPGLGDKKVKRLHQVLHQSFKKKKKGSGVDETVSATLHGVIAVDKSMN
jgi:DNA excision repair protein ERCC-1